MLVGGDEMKRWGGMGSKGRINTHKYIYCNRCSNQTATRYTNRRQKKEVQSEERVLGGEI